MNIKQILLDYLKTHSCDGFISKGGQGCCRCAIDEWFMADDECCDAGSCVPAIEEAYTHNGERCFRLVPVNVEPGNLAL